MKITISIDEDRIAELVEKEIVSQILKNATMMNYNAKRGVKVGTDQAVKEYIYANKEEIIERVVQRASVEIVKKGLPKLLSELGK
jgi:transcription elongation factor